jgi:tol-pal system-associated acyl-CoA thioesterase
MEALSSFFSSEFRVYIEDTDEGGIMYYANYLKFAERGRTEMLRKLGIDQSKLLDKHGIIFVVKNCSINFIKPAKRDDVICVKTLAKRVQYTSVQMVQNLYKEGELLCEIEIVIACVKKSETDIVPVKIPLDIASTLRGGTKIS